MPSRLTFSLILLSSTAALAAVPNGFAVYSKGNEYSRSLHMVTLAPGMSASQIAATETQICARGAHGGDIQGQISFDGKWLAFTRSVDAGNLYGGNDYHLFEGWSVYIIELHVPGAQPIQVAGKGSYWPSWAADSTGANKTLYYSTQYLNGSPKKGTVRAVTVGANGGLSGDREVANIHALWPTGFEGFIMAAPNGNFVAARWSGAVHTAHFSGPLAGQAHSLNGGCMPAVCADSKWIVHANNKRGRFDGSATGSISGDGSGDYHYGSSVDMQWFVARTAGNWEVQNNGYNVHLFTLNATSSNFITSRQVLLTNNGSWPDVHTWPAEPPELTSISVSPPTVSIAPNGSAELTATVLNQYSAPFDAALDWGLSGGGNLTPAQSGAASVHTTTFTSDGSLGTFTITASANDVSDSAVVVVEPQPDVHIRINAGDNSFDAPGWDRDDGYVSGGADWNNPGQVSVQGVANAAPASIYRTVRHQTPHSYSFAGVPNGTYRVRLHFADAFSDRSMDYAIEGNAVLNDFDIASLAGGSNKALVQEFVVDVVDGNGLQINASSNSNDVFECAVEVISIPSDIQEPPQNLQLLSASDSTMTMGWTPASGQAMTYNLYRSSTPGVPLDPGALVESNISETTFVDSALNPGATYCYVVTAIGTAGESVASNEECGSTTGGGPSISVLEPAGGETWCAGSEQTLRWQATGLTDVSIYVSTDGGTSWQGVAPSVDDASPDWRHYVWTVPDETTEEAIIRITGYSGEAPTQSAAFAIIDSTDERCAGSESAPAVSEGWTGGCVTIGPGNTPGCWLGCLAALLIACRRSRATRRASRP